jgi:hypothetical protein
MQLVLWCRIDFCDAPEQKAADPGRRFLPWALLIS